MEVGGISGGPGPNWGLNWNLPLVTGHLPQISKDLIDAGLAQLATHEIGAMLLEIENRRLAVDPQVANATLREVAAAVQQGRIPEALARINALVRAMPGVVDALRKEPALEPIRNEVEALIRGIAAERKQVLEPVLMRATELVENRGPQPMGNDGTDTRAMIAVAMRFTETGRIQDLVRAEELLGAVIRRYRLPATRTAGAGASEANWLSRSADWVNRIWARAPLLVLMIAWIILGVCGLISLKAWATGLLALVVLGFYSRVRHIRF